MIEVHFDPTSYSYYVLKFHTNQYGQKTHYSTEDGHYPIQEGQDIKPLMVLNGDTYEELKQYFLTEHEQPLEAKQAAIDELRDSLRIERIRVDQLLTRASYNALNTEQD